MVWYFIIATTFLEFPSLGVVHGATFIDAVVDEVGEEDTEHHHDEDRAEDQEEVLVHVELILSVDYRSLLVGEVVKHLNKNICRK